MFQRILTFPAFVLVALLASSVSVAAVPMPQPSNTGNGEFLCPGEDYAGNVLTQVNSGPLQFTCVYGQLSVSQPRHCTYHRTVGNLIAYKNEGHCVNEATWIFNSRRREVKDTNFTAMKRKVEQRAALPKTSVPDFMQTRRGLKRLAPSSSD